MVQFHFDVCRVILVADNNNFYSRNEVIDKLLKYDEYGALGRIEWDT